VTGEGGRRWGSGRAVLVVLLVAGMIVGLGPARARLVRTVGGWAHRLEDVAAAVPQRRLAAERAAAGGAALLLVVTDGTGAGVAFGILTRDAAGEAVLVALPSSLVAILPGYGEFTLGEAVAFEGPGLAAVGVENALGVRVDGTVRLEAAALPALRDVPPGDVAALLTPGDAADPLVAFRRRSAALAGVLRAVGSDPTAVETLAAGAGSRPEAARGLLALAGAGLETATLPVAVAGGGERLAVREGDATALLRRRMPDLLLAEGRRPRLEVLNGNGRLQATRPIAEVLIGAGYRLVRTDNAENFSFPTTLVIAQGRENAGAARRVVELLGVGALRLEVRAPSGAVDVSIIVGQDVPTGEG